MKKLVRVFLLSMLLVLVVPGSAMAYTNTYTRDGAVLWACERGNERWWGDVDGAYGCQCVDLILAYYRLLVGYTVGGNACDYQWNALPTGWTRVSTPAPGDIAVWAPGAQLSGGYDPRWANGTFGHIGIVWAVNNDGTMGTIETNAKQGQAAAYYQRLTSTAACYIRPDFPPALGVKSGTSSTKTTITWSADPNWDLYNLRIRKMTAGSYTVYKDVWGLKNTSYSLVLPEGSYQVYVDGCKSWNPNIFAKSLDVNFTVAKGATVYKVGSVNLSSSTYIYDGKVKKPSVTVKNTSGKTLVNGTDYNVTYAAGRTKVGRYKVTITFKGKYSGKKELYFVIAPQATKTVKAVLYGYDDVEVSWNKVSGATGYRVYYKKASDKNYVWLTDTFKTTYKKADLADGAAYSFKIVPYYSPLLFGTKYFHEASGKAANVTTLKKVSVPKVIKSGKKVNVTWTDISGETGYQISQATGKSKTSIVLTGTGTSKTVNAKKGKTLYYKVRAYKKVGNKMIYGPWSDVKAFVCK